MFNTPFGETPSESSLSYTNNDDTYTNGIQNDNDDFNFQADPIQNDFDPS